MSRDYLSVETGQDLVRLGIKPKSSSRQMALIAYDRLTALRDHILAGIADEMLGRWEPLVEVEHATVTETADPAIVRSAVKVGSRVRGKQDVEGHDLSKTEGRVVAIVGDQLGVEWDTEVHEGHDLGEHGPCAPGRGLLVTFKQVVLLAPEGLEIPKSHRLAPGVVADEQLGHKVCLRAEHRLAGDAIPAGTVGTLVAHDAKVSNVTLRFEALGALRKTLDVTMALDVACDRVDVSSLGQLAPLDRDVEVRKKVLAEFFPATVVDTGRAERIVIALLMGKDLILYGPPGGGKSNIAKDILDIARRGQPVIFVEEDCQVQCNPFSIFDAEFAREIDACPECKIKYDPQFKRTGRFRRPRPEQVRVKAAEFGEGQGIEYVEGTVGLQRIHLAGHKIPRLDGDPGEGASDFDPEGFHAGILPRTNNGVLHLDEMEKLRPQTRDCLLDALNSNRIKPEQLRYTYPAHALIIGTTNDHTKFSGAINDRMAMIAVRYPEDVDTSYDITRRGYHGERSLDARLSAGDPHQEEGFWLRSVAMPVTLELAVDALYIRFRAEYRGAGASEITGSNRSKFDALDAARAKLLLEQLFDDTVPRVVDRERAAYGVKFAFCVRVQGMGSTRDRKAKAELREWVDRNFDEVLHAEEDAWWCRVYKHVATAATQVPTIIKSFKREVERYEANAETAWASFLDVRRAIESPDDTALQRARLDHPFVDYLFRDQPGFGRLTQRELADLVGALLESRQRTTCTLDD